MDITADGQLTADDTPGTRLVAVSIDVSVMGVSQTPLLLALVRGDLDLDAILQFMIKEIAYVDDLPTAVLPKEKSPPTRTVPFHGTFETGRLYRHNVLSATTGR